MAQNRRKGILLYSCLFCEGAWLPETSVTALYEQASSGKKWAQVSALATESDESSSSVNCPCCVDTSLEIIEVHGIELDVCVSCAGVFFDMGELKALKKQLKAKNKEYGFGEHLAGEILVSAIISVLSGG